MLGNSLTRIGGPVFGLDDHFDLIVTEQGTVALSQAYFELLSARRRRYCSPSPSGSTRSPLHPTGRRRGPASGGTRPHGRPAPPTASLDRRTGPSARGHDRTSPPAPASGQANPKTASSTAANSASDDANPFELIYLLNEDFFQGGLTDVAFRSDRNSQR
jgi:hypothetical protein